MRSSEKQNSAFASVLSEPLLRIAMSSSLAVWIMQATAALYPYAPPMGGKAKPFCSPAGTRPLPR
jgi:hypothetical protein